MSNTLQEGKVVKEALKFFAFAFVYLAFCSAVYALLLLILRRPIW